MVCNRYSDDTEVFVILVVVVCVCVCALVCSHVFVVGCRSCAGLSAQGHKENEQTRSPTEGESNYSSKSGEVCFVQCVGL